MPQPETTTLELRTDSVEQLIDALEIENAPNLSQIISRDRRRAVADRLRKQMLTQDAVALCGLPGAGKSHVADELATVYGASVVSMGDAIRAEFKDRNGREHRDSNELGNFAAEWREEAAEEIPEKVAELAGETGAELVIIDGVRSETDYGVLNEYFDNFYLIDIQAEFYERLDRLKDRGREGEEEFDAVDLAKRGKRERQELGYDALLAADRHDLTLQNGKHSTVAVNLSNIVENILPFEIQDGRPLGLDDELEKYRRGEITALEVNNSV